MVFDASDVAQRKLGVEGIAAHLCLDGFMGVVEKYVARSSTGRIAGPRRQLAAAHAG
jgi:hypothetical protein